MAALSPTAHPDVGLRKNVPQRVRYVPLTWGVHDSPPFVDLIIVPCSPTAYPVDVAGKLIAFNALLTPVDWLSQVVPPSVVFRIVPKSPTAQPVVRETNCAP